jgi:hypothetical protein
MTSRRPLVMAGGQIRQIADGDILDAPAISGNGIPLATVDHSHTGLVGFGVSFPASPATNQVFFRQDLGVMCNWNGTYWLSPAIVRTMSIYSSVMPISANGTTTLILGLNGLIYTEYIDIWTLVQTTNNSSNYWTTSLYFDSLPVTSVSTSGHAMGAWIHTRLTINGAFTYLWYQIFNATKTGNPGTFQTFANVRYREIIT